MVKRGVVRLVLTILGVAGVGATSYLSVKCSKKADQVEDKKDKVIAYVPAIMSGVVTAGCIIGAHRFGTEDIAALTATAGYLAASREKISDKIKEKFGVEKLREINQEISKEKAEEIKNEQKQKESERTFVGIRNKKGQSVEETGYGNELFQELFLGRKFRSSKAHVRDSINRIKYDFHMGKPVSMNDFYEYLEIDKTLAGESFGWPANDKYYDWKLEDPLDIQILDGHDEDGEPMSVIDFNWGSYPMEGWMSV